MNTRQISQGLIPTIEYERNHTYKTFRYFPELKKSVPEVDNMKLKRSTTNTLWAQSEGIKRTKQISSMNRLETLSKSSLDEVTSVMDDFRKILIQNRRKNQIKPLGSRATSPSSTTKPRTQTNSPNSETSPINETNLFNQSSSKQTKEDDEYASLSPIEAADSKLTKVSISYDAQSYNSHLAGFSGAKLSKQEFEIQLRRCINIVLKKTELDALFEKMDNDLSGMIDGVEFVRYFFNLGNEARWKMQMETKDIQRRKKEESKKRRLEEERKIKEWEASQIANFTPEDNENAMRKLTNAALKWDPLNSVDSAIIGGFEAYLTPFQFKQQIDKSFGVKLTGAEIGSLIHEFSTKDHEYCVDGHLFVKKFSALHKKAWEQYSKCLEIQKQRKLEVLNMAQQVDCLPKVLGR